MWHWNFVLWWSIKYGTFLWESCRKCAPKPSPRPIFNFCQITQNSHFMQEILLKISILKGDYQKALKKWALFFLSNPVPFSRQSYQKQKGSGTSDQSLFKLRNKFKNIPLFVMYYLTIFHDVMSSSFWVIPKIASANLCKSVHNIINYSTSIIIMDCPFESGKCGKKGKN